MSWSATTQTMPAWVPATVFSYKHNGYRTANICTLGAKAKSQTSQFPTCNFCNCLNRSGERNGPGKTRFLPYSPCHTTTQWGSQGLSGKMNWQHPQKVVNTPWSKHNPYPLTEMISMLLSFSGWFLVILSFSSISTLKLSSRTFINLNKN